MSNCSRFAFELFVNAAARPAAKNITVPIRLSLATQCNSILKKKCTTYISLLSLEKVLSTLHIFLCRLENDGDVDDQSDGPIMNYKDTEMI